MLKELSVTRLTKRNASGENAVSYELSISKMNFKGNATPEYSLSDLEGIHTFLGAYIADEKGGRS
jgi:hypothetical protein